MTSFPVPKSDILSEPFVSPTDYGALGAVGSLRDQNALVRALIDSLPQMVWSTLPDGYHDYYNAQWYAFTGVPEGTTDGEGWNDMFHPDDQDRAWTRWRHSLATGEPYEIEYRLRHRSGDYRWVLGRALPVRDDAGTVVRWIGTCTDIHAQKAHAEQNEILSRELSHRIKNIFAVIGGLIGLSARSEPAARDFADELRSRVEALGRAHEFVRPHSEESAPTVGPSTLKAMLTDLFSAYNSHGETRLVVTGEDTELDDRGATPIARVFHELATNAAKYGALSVGGGHVDVTISIDADQVRIAWRETGGPSVTGKPDRTGFGTKLTEMSIVHQLGGKVTRDWSPDGLSVVVEVGRERLTRN
jgi:PAS domain S-box-containing protein